VDPVPFSPVDVSFELSVGFLSVPAFEGLKDTIDKICFVCNHCTGCVVSKWKERGTDESGNALYECIS